MVMRAVICKDDPTSHGGVVVEGNMHATVCGRHIAQKGHMTRCPRCKGDFPIAEGLGFHTFAGVGTAVEGMKTGCGAILIATTTRNFMVIDDRSDAEESAAVATEAWPAQAVASNFGCFRAVDENTGEPVADMPYRIDLPDGSVLHGVTNADGYTARVTGHDPAAVTLHWETAKTTDGA